MVLAAEDYERALDVIQTVNEARTRDEFVSLCLTSAKELIPCMVASVNEIDPVAKRFVEWHEPRTWTPPDSKLLLVDLPNEHPIIRYYNATGDGSAKKFSDFVTQDELHATHLYRELYRPMRMEYQMSALLPAEAPKIFALIFGNDVRDFTERDRLVLNRIRPILAQIWRRVRDMERLESLVAASKDSLSDQGLGVILLYDPPEELVPGSFDTLYRYFGQPAVDSTIPGRVAVWLEERLDHPVGSNALDTKPPLMATRGGRQTVVRFLPGGNSHPGAITIEGSVTLSRSNLEAFGLTRREAQVVHLVTTGMSNQEVAERLTVSPGTVRKHLDNVYTKLGVHSRGTLTALLFDLAGG